MIAIVLFTGTTCRGTSSATRAKISAWIGSYGKNLKKKTFKEENALIETLQYLNFIRNRYKIS